MQANRPLTIAALTLTLLATYSALKTFTQDITFTNTKTEVGFWGRGDYQPTNKTRSETGYEIYQLLTESPSNPRFLSLAASHAAWEAYWSEDKAHQLQLRELAMAQQHSALQARPAHRQSWKKLVEYASRAPAGEPLLEEAQHRLQGLRPG